MVNRTLSGRPNRHCIKLFLLAPFIFCTENVIALTVLCWLKHDVEEEFLQEDSAQCTI